MTEPLALKYRPKKFSDLIGQRLNAVVLQQMVDTKTIPLGLLFSGPSGTGKTSAARVLAEALGDSEFIEIDAASNGGVAEIRKLISSLQFSTGGEYRVVIIDEAHSISREGFNALLKTLEEPPSGVIFVLVTTEPYKIPDTTFSRLIEFHFRSINAPELMDRLVMVATAEKTNITAELLHHIAQTSDGNARVALNTLDHVTRASVSTVEAYVEITGQHDPAPALIVSMMTGDPAQFFAVFEAQLALVGSPAQVSANLVSCIRDLFVLRAGGDLPFTGARFESRKELSRRLEPERLLAAVRVLWELKTKVRNSVDPRGDLELALVLIAEVLSRGRAQPVDAPVPSAVKTGHTEEEHAPPRKLSLSDLQRMK